MSHKMSIAESLSKLNKNFSNYLSVEELESYCASAGMRWRKRILTPGRTINLFLLQILHKNTACSHVRHMSSLKFSTMAYCKARARIPLAVMEMLFNSISQECSLANSKFWKGHRVWLEDGTGSAMPDTPSLRNYFGQPGAQKQSCGFPVTSALLLIDAATGMLKKMLASPLSTREMTKAVELHPALEKGDVIVGDRGFCSFAQLMLLFQRGVLRSI